MAKKTSSSDKKEKKRKNSGIRVATLNAVLVLILIYFVFYFGSYLYSGEAELYEVVSGSTDPGIDSTYTALALRSETVIGSTDSGYINFFIADSSHVNVGARLYVIDESGELYERLEEAAQNSAILDENDLSEIRTVIYDFDTSYDRSSYSDVYNTKNRIESRILDLLNSSVFSSISSDVSSSDTSYTIVSSDISGYMLHSVDGFEDVTVDSVDAAMFRENNYSRTIIKSNDYVEQGDSIGKIVTSEEWSLVFRIEDSSDFDGKSSLSFTFTSDDVSTYGSFSTFTRAGTTYGVITLDKYLVRYISDRYIDIKISSDSESGLTVPKTAVSEQQFYKIPIEYATMGGDSNSTGFLKQTGSTTEFITPEISYEDDEYYYVSTSLLESGDILLQSDTNEQFTVSEKANMTGVYVYESGSYVFTIVDILGENGSYYIVKSGVSYSISIYDQILKDYTDNL